MLSYDVWECGAPLRRVERAPPTPTRAEVMLRVIAAGVCHSDLHIWDGGGQRLQLKDRGITLPLTMGHENVGEVLAVGPDAQGVSIGDVRLIHPPRKNVIDDPDYSPDWPSAPGGVASGITSGFDDEHDIALMPPPHDQDPGENRRWSEQWLPHAAWLVLALAAQEAALGEQLESR